MFGKCEVFPDKPCVWTQINERADSASMNVLDMKGKLMNKIQPSVDWSLVGTSAFGNMANGSIDSHGAIQSPHPNTNRVLEDLIASDAVVQHFSPEK